MTYGNAAVEHFLVSFISMEQNHSPLIHKEFDNFFESKLKDTVSFLAIIILYLNYIIGEIVNRLFKKSLSNLENRFNEIGNVAEDVA